MHLRGMANRAGSQTPLFAAEVVERFVKERRPELGPREQLEALRAMESARHEELKLRVGYRQAMQRLDLATRPCPGR